MRILLLTIMIINDWPAHLRKNHDRLTARRPNIPVAFKRSKLVK